MLIFVLSTAFFGDTEGSELGARLTVGRR